MPPVTLLPSFAAKLSPWTVRRVSAMSRLACDVVIVSTFMRFLFVLVSIVLCFKSCPAAEPAWPVTTLFQEGTGDHNNYRIPSLIRTTKGSILAFCEGRQTPHGGGNDTGSISIILRRSPDGGLHFGPVSVVWTDGKNTCGNPCPVVDQSTGTIWMLATHNLGEDRASPATVRWLSFPKEQSAYSTKPATSTTTSGSISREFL